MKKKIWGIFLFAFAAALAACGEQTVTQTGLLTPSPEPSGPERQEGETSHEEDEAGAPSDAKTPVKEAYRDYAAAGDICLRFSEDPENKKVIIRNASGGELETDWEYDLSYGDPVIYYTGETNFASYRMLYVGVPQQECEPVSPIGAREICGTWYEVWYDTVQNTITAKQANGSVPELYAGIARAEDGHLQLKLQQEYSGGLAEEEMENASVIDYPAVFLPQEEELELVTEEALHITDTMLSYRRVGVRVNGEILWLGKIWKAVSDADNAGQSFLPDRNAQYGENASAVFDAWRASGEFLPAEPDMSVDLDGDGIDETVSYRKKTEGVGKNAVFLCINGREMSLNDDASDAVLWQVDSSLRLVSLDGRTVQLVLKTWENTDDKYMFYRYEDGQLFFAGWMPAAEYCVIGHNESGGVQLSARFTDGILLQQYSTARVFEYESGRLKEIEQDFYEFYRGRTITAKKELELYREPEGEETVIVPAGSLLYAAGSSDLKEWVLLENAQTGELGWMRMASETECVLPGGESAESGELFDGLWFGS